MVSEPTGGERVTAASAPLAPDERAELEQLREEIETLRTAPPRRPKVAWKSLAAGIFIVLGVLLAPISLATVWLHNQVSNTDRFVANVSPLIREPSVQAALTDRVTDTVFTYVDVQALAGQAVDALAAQGLPPALADRLRGLTGALASSVHGFVHSEVGALVSGQAFAEAWDRAIRVAHEQATSVLSGNSSAVTISGGEVRLDLAPFIDAAKQQLVASGFTAASRVPEVHPTIAVTDATNLIRAQSAYNALDKLATWLPWIALVLLAAGVYLARNHRRALLNTGCGLAASMLVLAATLLIVRSALVNSVPSRAVAPAEASYDIIVRFLRDGLRTLLVLGLVIALGAFLAGPSITAVRIRSALARLVAWLRRGGARAGLRTGPVGNWVHTYRSALQIGVVAVAVLVFVFIERPSGLTVLLIAILLVVCLGVIQFLDQPPAPHTG